MARKDTLELQGVKCSTENVNNVQRPTMFRMIAILRTLNTTTATFIANVSNPAERSTIKTKS